MREYGKIATLTDVNFRNNDGKDKSVMNFIES